MNFINNLIIRIIPLLPKFFIKIFANKYVAGIKTSEALTKVEILNSKNQFATIDILGEHTESKEECLAITNKYIELIKIINDKNINCNLSIKPSHIGLDVNLDFSIENFKKIQKKASELNNFIRIDMESSSQTDDTIKIFSELHKTKKNIGIVFQAYLYRTEKDLKRFKNINIRLCKGIYNESEKIAIKDPIKINKNFLHLLKIAFEQNMYVGIATHDQNLIQECIHLIKQNGITKEQFEFQYLYGVPMSEPIKLFKNNKYKVRAYVPYGKNWYDYSIRRIKENPKISSYIIKNILK
tara:strand:- start:1023 stop:1913 length:891 start_codon:yes stop_codon:yes gene_type:complete